MLQKILDKLLKRSASSRAKDHVHPNDVDTVDMGPRGRKEGQARSPAMPFPDSSPPPSPRRTFWPEGEKPLAEGLDVAETVFREESGRESPPPSRAPGGADEPDEPDTQDSFIAEIARVGPTEGRAPLPDLVAHQIIGGGRYRVVGLLGKGGMGAVYEAEDLRLGRHVALKVLLHDGGNDDWRRRFFRESKATAAITHPNVAAVYDADEDGGRYFIEMELVRGKSLRAALAEGPMPLDRVIHVAREIALGLGAAHGKGIIHRDIKPDNIMISDEGGVKLLDFGIAKIAAGSLHKEPSHRGLTTKTGVVLGTPSYMSPEQAKGAKVDHRTDLFSFGVVLHEMVTGRRPFNGKTHVQVILDVVNGVPEPASSVNPRTPPAMQAIIDRCLQKQPEDRFQDAGELLAALDGGPVSVGGRAKAAETVVDGAPSSSPKGRVAGSGRALRRRVRPWRSWGLLGAAAVVGMLGGGWLARGVMWSDAGGSAAPPGTVSMPVPYPLMAPPESPGTGGTRAAMEPTGTRIDENPTGSVPTARPTATPRQPPTGVANGAATLPLTAKPLPSTSPTGSDTAIGGPVATGSSSASAIQGQPAKPPGIFVP